MSGRAVGVVRRWKRTRWSAGSGSCEMDVKARPTEKGQKKRGCLRPAEGAVDGWKSCTIFCFVFVSGLLGGGCRVGVRYKRCFYAREFTETKSTFLSRG
jgi:hypothetical protein